MNFTRKVRRKQGQRSPGRGSAAVGQRPVKQKERRMPEAGEKFVLAGPDFVTPVLFLLEGYTDDGRAIIRFAKEEDFQKPTLPGLPIDVPAEAQITGKPPAIIQTGVSA